MNRQYVKYTYLGNIAKFASNVVMMSGMNENAALARIVVSDIIINCNSDDITKLFCGIYQSLITIAFIILFDTLINIFLTTL